MANKSIDDKEIEHSILKLTQRLHANTPPFAGIHTGETNRLVAAAVAHWPLIVAR